MSTPDPSAHDIFQPSGKLRLDRFTETAQKSLREAVRMARETNWVNLRSPHVFMGLLAAPDAGVRNWGERMQADLTTILHRFRELFMEDEDEDIPILALTREFMSDNAIRLLREAYQRAAENHRDRVTPMDLLISLLTASDSVVAGCFERIGVTAAKLTEHAVLAERVAGG